MHARIARILFTNGRVLSTRRVDGTILWDRHKAAKLPKIVAHIGYSSHTDIVDLGADEVRLHWRVAHCA